MREPSLLDVFNRIVTGRRVLRVLLALAALYWAWRGLQEALASAWFWTGVNGGLALLAAVALARIRSTSSAVDLGSLGLPPLVLPRGQAEAAAPGLAVWRAVRPALALGLAVLAQAQLFQNPDQYLVGLALWLAALGLWVPVLRERPAEAAAPAMSLGRLDVRWTLAGLGLAAVAFVLAGDHLYTPPLVAAWIGGLLLTILGLLGGREALVAGWARLRGWAARVDVRDVRVQLSGLTLAVIAIIALGTYLRFYRLYDIPREMTSDHVEKLLDVQDVLNGQYTIFFPRNTGREPFQFYYTAALMRLLDLPLSFLALKVGTAIAGSLTLVGLYFLAREVGGTEVGVWTLLLAAVLRWPISLSRAGLRYPFAPLFFVPALYFFLRGLKSGRRSDFIWAGLFTGVGLHGYTSFRVVPIVLAVLLGLWLLWQWRRREAGWQALAQGGLAAGLVVLAVCAPLLRYALDEPEMFWYRVLSRVSTTEQALPGSPLELLWTNLYRVLLMFNYTRDVVWTVNISNAPTLSALPAALFGLGLVTLLVRALRGDRQSAGLVAAWLLLLLPSGLSITFPGENPSLARVGIAFPLVTLFAAWALTEVRRRLHAHWPGMLGRGLALAIVLAVVGLTARRELTDFYVTFRDQYALSATNPSEVGRVVRAFVAGGVRPENVWLKGYPFRLDTRSVALESFDTLSWSNSFIEVSEMERAGFGPESRLFIVHIWDQPAIAWLREHYPSGRLTLHDSPTEGKDFLTYFVPGEDDLDESTLPPPP